MSPLPFGLKNKGQIATISVVGISFLVSFLGFTFSNEPLPSLHMRLLALGVGVVYLYLLLQGEALERRSGTAVYFIILFILAAIIHFALADAVGIWLITMPLVGIIVEDFPRRWRAVGYAAILSLMTLSVGITTGHWNNAILLTIYFSPALIFVAIFAHLLQLSNRQREEAERLTKELAQANRQLGAYATQAEELAITKERNRLAREIHDNLGHYLTVVNMQIKAAQAIMSPNPELAQAALQKAQQMTEEGLTAVRHSVAALRELPLAGQPLPEAVAALVQAAQSTGIVTELAIHGTPRSLDSKTDLTFYRAVQEGLTNVRKHAYASRVDLTLDYSDPSQVQLVVKDNGVGLTNASAGGGFGLLGLRERAQLLGGQVELQTAPGQGFQLAIALPG